MNSGSVRLSKFGEKLASHSGILQLMDDLGEAISGRSGMRMLGGGNPAAIPEIQAIWRRRMEEILADGDRFERMLTNYDTPQGDTVFIESFARMLRKRLGWDVGPKNITVMNGGQMAFFCLFNMLAGAMPDGSFRRVLFPLMPEYIGYADQFVDRSACVGLKPEIEFIGRHRFKYHVDIEKAGKVGDLGAVCISRPTNPSGNVVPDDEVASLAGIAESRGVPLIIDNAYGIPFPGIVFCEPRLDWNPGIACTFSLSKLGLPGTRTGVVVASEAIVKGLISMNSILSLANGNIGQVIVTPMLDSGEILRVSRELIRPFYERRARQALEWTDELFDDGLDYFVHHSEGGLFHWFWFRGLPIGDTELYRRLKKRGVLVVPGSPFFYGLSEEWAASRECIRVNYSQPEHVVREGLAVIADEVRKAYR
jgi:valine--pyruvate aminotransferase